MTSHGSGKQPRSVRSSRVVSDAPRFMNPSPPERNWIRTIPDFYPDIMRAPAVTYRAERDLARIQSNKYVAFARPYRAKQGLLIIGKEHRPISIDETQPNSPQIIPMRLDRETIQGTWVFATTIYMTEGLIQLEDCIVSNGQQVRSAKTYRERFAMIQKFADTIWYQDNRFQLGWKIQMANPYPLSDIRTVIAQGGLCLMPDLPTFRLLKVVAESVEVAPIVGGPSEYVCYPVEGKPDVYDLKTPAGKTAGRASIQTLSISLALQQKKATGQPLRVMAEWNSDFESHVVTSVL